MKYIKNNKIATAGFGKAIITKKRAIYNPIPDSEVDNPDYEPVISHYEDYEVEVYNATEQMLIDSGYEPYVEPELEPYTSYKQIVEQYIAERYTLTEELAIHRQKDAKPLEWQEYYDYCEACKARAREELSM